MLNPADSQKSCLYPQHHAFAAYRMSADAPADAVRGAAHCPQSNSPIAYRVPLVPVSITRQTTRPIVQKVTFEEMAAGANRDCHLLSDGEALHIQLTEPSTGLILSFNYSNLEIRLCHHADFTEDDVLTLSSLMSGSTGMYVHRCMCVCVGAFALQHCNHKHSFESACLAAKPSSHSWVSVTLS